MIWVDILVVLVLVFSFIGGLWQGGTKTFFALIAHIIAIPLAGLSYRFLATVLSFLPGETWENFVGFLVTLALISIVLHLVLFFPRKSVQLLWREGLFSRLVGAVLNAFNSAIGLVVFTLLVQAYPIAGWLEGAVTGSSTLTWLVMHLAFVQIMLPEVFRHSAHTVVAHPASSFGSKTRFSNALLANGVHTQEPWRGATSNA